MHKRIHVLSALLLHYGGPIRGEFEHKDSLDVARNVGGRNVCHGLEMATVA